VAAISLWYGGSIGSVGEIVADENIKREDMRGRAAGRHGGSSIIKNISAVE